MKKGFVALISVIIVGSIILSISIFMIFINLNASYSGLIIKNSDQARSLAQSCSEYALQKIKEEPNFIGSNTFSFLEGACYYEIFNNGDENRRINSQALVKNISRREVVIINQISPDINIESWQEVADF